MDLKDLNLDKASVEKLLEGVVEAAVDELYKGDIIAGGPVEPDHAAPGLANDFGESDAVAEQEGVATKAEDEDDEEDDEEKKKKEGNPFAEKADTSSPDLSKALMKSVVGMQKAITGLTEKVETFSKGAARTPKSVAKEEDVEVIEKGNKEENSMDDLIKSKPRAIGAALLKMHTEGKINGRDVTEYELYGSSKLTDNIKKAALAEVDLVK